MATQRFLKAFQPARDSIPHPPPANSTDNTCDGMARLISEADSVSQEKLVSGLRAFANPLCKKGEAVEPKRMQQLVDKSATVKLNYGKWHFELGRPAIPDAIGMPLGRCQGMTSQAGLASQLSFRDETCKAIDTALAQLCLQDAVRLVPDKSGVFWCWDFCKKFIKACARIGPRATVDQMAAVRVKVLVRMREISITFLAFFKELEDSWRQELLDWSNYVLNSERSWPALGLEADPNKPQQAAGVYTYEGHPMTLLREAIRTWTRHHAFRAFHIRAATNGYHVAPADQVALQNPQPGQAAQLDSQPVLQPAPLGEPAAGVVPRGADEHEPAVGLVPLGADETLAAAASLAECATSITPTALGGQVVPLHPDDSLTMRQAAVPRQQPGAAASAESQPPPWSPMTFHAHVDFDHDILGEPEEDPLLAFLDVEDYIEQQTDGSVRLNVQLNVEDITQQAAIIQRLVHRIIGKPDSGIGFSITASCQGHLLVITRETGKGNTVQCSVDAKPQPTILAVYLTADTAARLVLEGYHLEKAGLWCFRDGEKPIEHLQMEGPVVASTAEPDQPEPDQPEPDQPTSGALPTKKCTKCGEVKPYSTDERYKKRPLSLEVGFNLTTGHMGLTPSNQCKKCINTRDSASRSRKRQRDATRLSEVESPNLSESDTESPQMWGGKSAMPPMSGTVKDQISELSSASPFSSMLSSGRGKQQQDEGERTKGKAQPDPGLTSQSLSEQPRKAMRMSTGTKAPRRSSLLAARSANAASASKAPGASAGTLPESAGRNVVSTTSGTAAEALTAQPLESPGGVAISSEQPADQKQHEGVRNEDFAHLVQSLALARSEQPHEQKLTRQDRAAQAHVAHVAHLAEVSAQAHVSAQSALQDVLVAITASAAPVAVASVGMPDFVSLLTREAEQQQQSAPGQKDLQTAVVELPEMIGKGGRFWLQAERDHCTSAPFALPTYSTVHEPEDASQQLGHWRRYMYPEALSRKARLNDDPIAELHRKDPPVQQNPPALGKHVSGRDGGVSAASAAQPQIAAASKVPLLACRQQPVKELDVTTWDKQDIMERDQENCSCLHALMQRVYTGTTRRLLSWMLEAGGARLLHTRSRWGHQAFHFAAANCHGGASLLNDLINLVSTAQLEDVVIKDCLEARDARGCTPLHLAAQQGNLEAVYCLVHHGADVMARDHADATPLHYAAVCPGPLFRSAIIGRLLSEGNSTAKVDVDVTDHNGLTALHWAAGNCLTSADLDGVRYLISNAKAAVNAADRLGNTPLHHAAASSTLPEVLTILVQHGAQADTCNVYGDTIVHTAAGFGNPSTDMLKALVDCLSSVVSLPLAEVNGANQTPLQLATVVGWSVSAVKVLQSLEAKQQTSPVGLLDLMVSCGWRLEIADHLVLQALAAGVKAPDLWPPLCLLRQKWKDGGNAASGTGRFVPMLPLEMRFRQYVQPSNGTLRRHLIASMFVVAGTQSQSGATGKILPDTVNFRQPSLSRSTAPSHPVSSSVQSVQQIYDPHSSLSRLEMYLKHFDVPMYQRPYSWTLKDVDKLLGDLLTGCTTSSELFLGSLVTFAGAAKDHFWVLDGQEPLITLVLILAFVMHWACAEPHSEGRQSVLALVSNMLGGPSGRWRLQLKESDQEFLSDNVLQAFLPNEFRWQHEPTDEAPATARAPWEHPKPRVLSNETHWRIYKNARHIRKTLTSALKNKEINMGSFLMHILTQCRFISIECCDEGSAFNVCSTISSSGQQLSLVDRIKAEMVQQLPDIADGFDALEATLGKPALEEVFSSYKQIQEWGSATPASSVLDFYSSVVNQGRTRTVIAMIFEYADLLCSFNQQSFVKVATSSQDKQAVLAVERLNSVCRFLCLLDTRDWVPFALEYCTLEHRSHKRAEFLLSLEALQVLLQLSEATAPQKSMRWNSIALKLSDKEKRPSQRTLEALTAARLTPTECNRFKAELGKSNFLEQDNLSIVKHLLLRAEKQLDWSKIVPSCFLVSHLLSYAKPQQVEQLLPEKPLPGTLWHEPILDQPSPDGSGARRHWTHMQMERASHSIGNLLLLQSTEPLLTQQKKKFKDKKQKTEPLLTQQKKMEFKNKKQKYLHNFNAGLFPMSADVLQRMFFSCNYEYADRQRAYTNHLALVYKL